MSENVGVLFKDEGGFWRFRVLDRANREVLAQSEAYTRRIDAMKTLVRLDVAEVDIQDG